MGKSLSLDYENIPRGMIIQMQLQNVLFPFCACHVGTHQLTIKDFAVVLRKYILLLNVCKIWKPGSIKRLKGNC